MSTLSSRRMVRVLSWAALGLVGLVVGCVEVKSVSQSEEPAPPSDKVFYVATNGNDASPGTEASPFATLQRARDEIRSLKIRNPQSTIRNTVFVRSGLYELPEPFSLAPQDSNTTYRACKDESPVISAGRRVTGWKVTGGRWEASLPEVAQGEWDFAQLFVGGERRYRTRLPHEGYYYIAGTAPSSPQMKAKQFDRFRFGGDDIHAAWSNLADVEIHAFHCWSTSRLRVASVDKKMQTVTLTGPTFRALSRGTRYLVENVKEALKRPGEWYLDRRLGTLTYLPMPGETPEKTVVIAPRLEHLMEMKGEIATGQWVERIVFQGLTFAHANWTTPQKGNCVSQAEYTMTAGIVAEGARDCAFERCKITQVGPYAIELGNGCKRNRIEGCEITDIGGGGVKIGPSASKDDEALASHNVVRDCLIAHCGRMHPAAVGIWLGYAHHNTLEHNEIYDLYYSGISAGWTWGYGPTPTRDNLIAYNHIHHTPQNVLTDMGGIYTLGVSPGTVLRGNHIHDLEGIPWAVGIYLDEGTSNVLVENNLVYRVTTHTFNVNYGREDVARNNIFGPILDPKAPFFRCGRMEDHLSMTVERNINYWKDGDLVDRAWPIKNCVLDYNLYWNAAGRPVMFKDMTFAQWQASGQDAHSLIADPLFENPEKGNFRLKPGSPAEKIGFRPFDVSKAGRLTKTKEPARLLPRAFPEATPNPPGPAPLPVSQDFEGVPVGGKDPEAVTQEENAQAVARVTDETAASGKRSLKFTDAAGQKNFYNPHVFYTPGFRSGTWTGRFDLRLEKGAIFCHDWRDNANPFRTGPSLKVEADGWLVSGGKRLLELPIGRWVHFEITCALGDQATGKYDLSVRWPGGPPQDFKGLPCNPDFKSLNWYGFVSAATGPSVFYLDNVELAPVQTK